MLREEITTLKSGLINIIVVVVVVVIIVVVIIVIELVYLTRLYLTAWAWFSKCRRKC